VDSGSKPFHYNELVQIGGVNNLLITCE